MEVQIFWVPHANLQFVHWNTLTHSYKLLFKFDSFPYVFYMLEVLERYFYNSVFFIGFTTSCYFMTAFNDNWTRQARNIAPAVTEQNC